MWCPAYILWGVINNWVGVVQERKASPGGWGNAFSTSSPHASWVADRTTASDL